jgi:clan AA aspartic protease (TIGR02281 family)
MNKLLTGILASLGILAFVAPAVRCEPYFERGVQLYNARQFRQAAPYLDQACVLSPWDSNAYYYRALCYQNLGDRAKATQYYGQCIKNFPGSTAANYAATALQTLDPAAYKRVMSGGPTRAPAVQVSAGSGIGGGASTSAQPDAELAAAPENSKIYFHNEGGHMVIDASVNNRNIKMIYDTGAEGCFMGTKQMQEMGMGLPQGKATGKNSGVSGTVDTWKVPMKIKVGQITRTIPVNVAEGDQMCLLGQTFFKDFDYEIERNASCINFHKKSAGGGGRATASSVPDRYAVPFTKGGGAGNEMTVTAEVKGRQCKMFFDTGAQITLFMKKDLKAMNIEVPDDAEEASVGGIGGTSKGVRIYLDELRMGPIIRRNFPITVLEKGEGLIGQDFIGEWRYKVDNSAKQIKFFH